MDLHVEVSAVPYKELGTRDGARNGGAQDGLSAWAQALPRNQSDSSILLAETAAIVHEIGSPAVKTMFDTHNAVDEKEPHAMVVDRYFELIRHVHVNEVDGKHLGTGDYDFKPVLAVLRKRGYRHWISLEAFDFTPGPERIASESLHYIEREAARIGL